MGTDKEGSKSPEGGRGGHGTGTGTGGDSSEVDMESLSGRNKAESDDSNRNLDVEGTNNGAAGGSSHRGGKRKLSMGE